MQPTKWLFTYDKGYRHWWRYLLCAFFCVAGSLLILAQPAYADAPPLYLAQWGGQGSGDGQFWNVGKVAVDSTGNVYVADYANSRIQKFSSTGTFLAKWGTYGTGNGQFQNPYGIALDSQGNIYVSDLSSHNVQKFDSSGAFLTKWGGYGTGNGQFNFPHAITVDRNGNLYVVDKDNHRIQKFDSNGNFLTKWGSYGTGNGQFDKPTDLAFDSAGNLYVTEDRNHRVQKFDSNGAFLATWGSYGTGNGQFNHAYGIAIDKNDNIYINDAGNGRFQIFTSSGSYLTQWGSQGSGNGQFQFPSGLALNRSSTLFYVSDNDNHRVQMFGILPGLVVQPNGVSLVNGDKINVPVTFTGNGATIASVGFALDYQESCLTFDATDSDNNSIPDAITGLSTALIPSISHQPAKTGGELEVALYDGEQPITPFSDGTLFTVQFTVKPACLPTAGAPTSVTINFAANPAATFGDPTGQDVTGATTGATIPLQAPNSAPTALSLDNSSVEENSAAGTTVGAFNTTDPDTDDSFTYSLVSGSGDSDNASFTLDGATLNTAAILDYETKSSYTIRVRTTDGGGLFFEQSFTISVTDVDETPIAVDDLVDPRTTVFLGGQTGAIDVLANDTSTLGTLTVGSVTQRASGGGSVTNNTTNVSYTAPNSSGSATFTYQASNGYATSNSATVSVAYVANHARGDCNGNGGISAADFIGVVLEIFDATNTKYQNQPAWWLTHTGDFAGSPLGCDANNSRNGLDNSSASVTAADITCSVLIFFGHACGTGVQAATADQVASLSVATVADSGQTTIPVTLKTKGQAVAAAAFALHLGDAAFDATDANGDDVPDAVTMNVPAGVTKAVIWNGQARWLEVALYGTSLPLPTFSDGVLVTVTVDGVATPTLTQVSLSDTNGNDLLAPTRTGLFLPLIAR